MDALMDPTNGEILHRDCHKCSYCKKNITEDFYRERMSGVFHETVPVCLTCTAGRKDTSRFEFEEALQFVGPMIQQFDSAETRKLQSNRDTQAAISVKTKGTSEATSKRSSKSSRPISESGASVSSSGGVAETDYSISRHRSTNLQSTSQYNRTNRSRATSQYPTRKMYIPPKVGPQYEANARMSLNADTRSTYNSVRSFSDLGTTAKGTTEHDRTFASRETLSVDSVTPNSTFRTQTRTTSNTRKSSSRCSASELNTRQTTSVSASNTGGTTRQTTSGGDSTNGTTTRQTTSASRSATGATTRGTPSRGGSTSGRTSTRVQPSSVASNSQTKSSTKPTSTSNSSSHTGTKSSLPTIRVPTTSNRSSSAFNTSARTKTESDGHTSDHLESSSGSTSFHCPASDSSSGITKDAEIETNFMTVRSATATTAREYQADRSSLSNSSDKVDLRCSNCHNRVLNLSVNSQRMSVLTSGEIVCGNCARNCYRCQKPLEGRSLAVGHITEQLFFHEDCLRCAACNTGLTAQSVMPAKTSKGVHKKGEYICGMCDDATRRSIMESRTNERPPFSETAIMETTQMTETSCGRTTRGITGISSESASAAASTSKATSKATTSEPSKHSQERSTQLPKGFTGSSSNGRAELPIPSSRGTQKTAPPSTVKESETPSHKAPSARTTDKLRERYLSIPPPVYNWKNSEFSEPKKIVSYPQKPRAHPNSLDHPRIYSNYLPVRPPYYTSGQFDSTVKNSYYRSPPLSLSHFPRMSNPSSQPMLTKPFPSFHGFPRKTAEYPHYFLPSVHSYVPFPV